MENCMEKNYQTIEEFRGEIVNVSEKELYEIYEDILDKYKIYKKILKSDDDLMFTKNQLKVIKSEMIKRKLRVPSFIDLYNKKQSEAQKYLKIRGKAAKRLYALEQELLKIENSLNVENINRNYDNINLQVDKIIDEINFICKIGEMFFFDQILEKKKHLQKRLKNIIEKFSEIGSIPRKEVFYELEKIDNSYDDAKLKEVLKWTWNKLNLGDVEYQKISSLSEGIEHKRGLKIHSKVYEIQIVDFELCLHYAIANNMFKATSSLNNFIAPYAYILKEPFNSFERLCIRTMIENMVKNMDKNIGRYHCEYEAFFE